MVTRAIYVFFVVMGVLLGTPYEVVGQLPNCTIDFDVDGGTCPDVTPECGATFSGGDGCNIIGVLNCYSSGFYSYQIAQGGNLTVTLSDDLNSLSVFFAHQIADGSGSMRFLDVVGQEVDAPIATDGPCVAGPMPSTQVLFFSRPVRTIEVDNTGDDNIWIDTFEVNPPCTAAGDCGDGDPCTTDTCNAGNCAHTPLICDDALFCNGVATCDPAVGCVPGAAPCAGTLMPVCDEDNDQCVECLVEADCAAGETCQNNTCVMLECQTAADCDDGLFCNGDETCDLGTNACVPGAAPCADPTPVCDEANDQCVECLVEADCDDGLATTADACAGGSCVFTSIGDACPADFDDDGEVDSADLAELLSGWGDTPGQDEDLDADGDVDAADLAVLLAGWGVCSDSSGCTTDADCDDGMFCNGAEVCDARSGECQDGTEPCTDLICDADAGSCVQCLTADDCDDGLFCTGAEICVNSECMLGADPCAEDESCDEDVHTCEPADDGDSDEDPSQPDEDGDGVSDDADQCSGTVADDVVDTDGCSDSQRMMPREDDDEPPDDKSEDEDSLSPGACGAGACGQVGMVSLLWMIIGLATLRGRRLLRRVPTK